MVNNQSSAYNTFINLIRVGSRVTLIESIIILLLPIQLITISQFQDFIKFNGLCQVAIFVPLVIIPALLTGHMAYVDLGWPLGLVTLGINALMFGDGYYIRKYIAGGLMVLHGSRMFIGALYLFYPYRWPQDLPRYRYSKLRWKEDGGFESFWPVKMVHDLLQQAFANSIALAVPIMLLAHDKSETISILEVLAMLMWISSWIIESKADLQKHKFDLLKNKPPKSVLGYGEFSGKEYSLWTKCRHLNYFLEWVCWIAWCIGSIPSLYRLDASLDQKIALGITLIALVRIFRDCLLYWTGSEPAEYYSYQKRPNYGKYQESTRVFWPFEMPFVDHGRIANWPRGIKKSS